MLVKAGLLVLVGTLLGRALGFLREVQLAAAFGAGQVAEAAIITLTLPDLLMNVLLGGAFSYALVPEFASLARADAWRLHSQMSILVVLVFGLAATGVGIFSTSILALYNQQLPTNLAEEARQAIALSAWLMPLIALSGVTTAYLQANSKYFATAFATSLYNVVLVVGLIGLIKTDLGKQELLVLSSAMILGGALRCIVLWCDSRRLRLLDNRNNARKWLVHHPLLKSYLFATMGGAALMLLPLIGRFFAGQYGTGYLAQFNYASKLVELPLGVAITVISVVVLPPLSKAFVSDQPADEPMHQRWRILLMSSLRLSVLLSLVIMLPCVWFAKSLVQVAFGWGKMDMFALAGIERLLEVGFLLLLVQGMLSITSAALASAKNSGALAWSGLAGLLVFLLVGGIALKQSTEPRILMLAMVMAYSAVLLSQCGVLTVKHQVHWRTFWLDGRLWYPVIAVLLTFTPIAWISGKFTINHWQGLFLAAFSMSLMGGAALIGSSEMRRIIFNKLGR